MAWWVYKSSLQCMHIISEVRREDNEVQVQELRWVIGRLRGPAWVDNDFRSVVRNDLKAHYERYGHARHCRCVHGGHSQIWKGSPFAFRMLVKYRVPAPVVAVSSYALQDQSDVVLTFMPLHAEAEIDVPARYMDLRPRQPSAHEGSG